MKHFKIVLANWDKEEDTNKEKLTTPISVLEHYKKYTIEEQKIIWQKTQLTTTNYKHIL